ncbi:MAG: hypothetical protein HYU33_00785 [Candidatus Omnitrophica bacterium]|nr:hypothetical protein [Candidatus Omnitrophota bacterium]
MLTDGQIRWEDIVTPFARGLESIEINGLSRWFNNNVYYRKPILHGEPVWKKPILVDAYLFAKSCTTKPVKAVLPGPYSFAILSEDRHYKNLRAFTRKMAELLNAEARALAQAGAAFIQWDEPAVGFGKTDIKLVLESLKIATEGVQAKTAVVTYYGSLNGALDSLMRGPVDVVGVDVVSDPQTYTRLKNLSRIPKELILGCMDARNTKLESTESLHRLIKGVAKKVGMDRLYLSPNCGLEFLPHTQALAKVKRLVQTARTFKQKN